MGWFAKERFSRQKLASLGFSAVVAYGLLDAVTYTIAFCVAFLTIERTKQINPVQDIKVRGHPLCRYLVGRQGTITRHAKFTHRPTHSQAVMSLVVLMWASNNVTRPFRIGGAAAMSPFVRRTAEWLQSKLRCVAQRMPATNACSRLLYVSRARRTVSRLSPLRRLPNLAAGFAVIIATAAAAAFSAVGALILSRM